MPFVEGESLRAKIAREGALPLGEALRLLFDVAKALAPQLARTTRFQTLAVLRPRWGYRRLHLLLRRERYVVNHKLVQRLYREEGLSVRRRKRKRKRVAVARSPILAPTGPNERWSMDFVSDALGDGRKFRALTIVDDFTRESPAIEVEHSHRDLVAAARAGTLSLMDLYDAHVTGQLDPLRGKLAARAIVDPNIEPLVQRWHDERLAGRSLTPTTRHDYVRHVRALLPTDVVCPASSLTETKVQSSLLALNVSDTTRKCYLASFRLFLKFARRHVPEVPHALEFESDWAPKNAPSRTTYWSHEQTLAVLDRMSGEPRRAMALVFGSSMELGALLGLAHGHLLSTRVVVAPGTKNSARRDRTILIDQWAADIFNEGLSPSFPTMPVFTFTHAELRKAFYRAQVDAGVVDEPKRSTATGKQLWGDVQGLHHIHDARHTL